MSNKFKFTLAKSSAKLGIMGGFQIDDLFLSSKETFPEDVQILNLQDDKLLWQTKGNDPVEVVNNVLHYSVGASSTCAQDCGIKINGLGEGDEVEITIWPTSTKEKKEA